jgi:hypothetical protein
MNLTDLEHERNLEELGQEAIEERQSSADLVLLQER